MTFLKMRHFAILGLTAVTVAAMFTEIELTQLVPFYGIMSTIIVADKVQESRKPTN